MTSRTDLNILPEPVVMVLGNLFTAFGKPLERPTALMYWRALHDIPVPLLEAALGKAVRERTFLPRPAEMRKDAETCRQEIRAAWTWKSCGACSLDGLIEREVDGVKRAMKCDCWEKHQRTLRELGAHVPALLSEPKPLQLIEGVDFDPRMARVGEDC